MNRKEVLEEAIDCLMMSTAPFPIDEARNLKAAENLKKLLAYKPTDEEIMRAADYSGAIVLEGFTVDMLKLFARELLQ